MLAELFGVSRQWIANLVRDGVLPPPIVRGKYELAPAISAYIQFLQKRAEDGDDDDGSKYRKAKARLTEAQADAEEIKVKTLKGELVDLKEVEDHFIRVFDTVQKRLQSLPTKLAPAIVSIQAIPEVKTTLEEEINQALNELANYNPEQSAENPKPRSTRGDKAKCAKAKAPRKPKSKRVGKPSPNVE